MIDLAKNPQRIKLQKKWAGKMKGLMHPSCKKAYAMINMPGEVGAEFAFIDGASYETVTVCVVHKDPSICIHMGLEFLEEEFNNKKKMCNCHGICKDCSKSRKILVGQWTNFYEAYGEIMKESE